MRKTHRVGIAAFTQRGRELAGKIGRELEREGRQTETVKEFGGESRQTETAERFGEETRTMPVEKAGQEMCEILWYEKDLKTWCGKCFEQVDCIIFIGACGIAVRTIAPFLRSKTSDPAVLVIDEMGQFVISLISGHIGGANEFALEVASRIGAVPVITTASDVNGKIAVDVFAKKNNLAIGSMQSAKKIAAAILRGEDVGVCCTGRIEGKIPAELRLMNMNPTERRSIDMNPTEQKLTESGNISCAGQRLPEDKKRSHAVQKAAHIIWISESEPTQQELSEYLSSQDGTVLHLIPPSVVLGVGCRKGKVAEDIRRTVEKLLAEQRIPKKAIGLAASIDLKKDEQGILELCRTYGIDFATYSAEELLQVEGDFRSSEFVRQTTGVDNVCERSALLAAGKNARLIREKYAENGVTAALAVREWRVRFEE